MSVASDSLMRQTISRIERLSRRDPGGRGFARFAAAGLLLPAAQLLFSGERAILVTGFCIRTAMSGETDGPSGTLALADVLQQLGMRVVLVTDRHTVRLLEVGATAYGTAYQTLTLSQSQSEADREVLELLARFDPTHVVAIERPGSAPDGHLYSMRGEVLDGFVPAADRLLDPGHERRYRTIAIGDGGNELGMGGLRTALKGRVAHGELIFCSTAADHVIAAGISNWGAHALAAALSLLAGRLLIRPPAYERAVLEAQLAAGAVDGYSGESVLSVDGVAWEDYSSTLSAIYAETQNALRG